MAVSSLFTFESVVQTAHILSGTLAKHHTMSFNEQSDLHLATLVTVECAVGDEQKEPFSTTNLVLGKCFAWKRLQFCCVVGMYVTRTITNDT